MSAKVSVLSLSPTGHNPTSIEGLLAESGFQEDLTGETHETLHYLDTWHGKLDRGGYRLVFREGTRCWILEGKGRVRRRAQGTWDLPEAGEPGIRARARAGRHPFIHHLTLRRTVRRFHAGGAKGAKPVSVGLETVSYVDPRDGRRAEGPPLLRVEGRARDRKRSEALQFLLAHVRDTRPVSMDPYHHGFAALGLPRPGQAPPEELRVSARDPMHVVAQTVVSRQAWRMRALRQGLIRDLDPEYLHATRVAIRRARTALKLFAPWVASPRVTTTQSELERLGTVLGRVRDLDVLGLTLAKALSGSDVQPGVADRIRDLVAARRAAALEEVLFVVRSEDTTRLLRAMDRLELLPTHPPGLPANLAAPPLIAATSRRVRKRGKGRVTALDDAQRHRLRLGLKRLRYAVDALDDALPVSVSGHLGALDTCRRTLGAAQDAATAAGLLHGLAAALCSRGTPDPEIVLCLGALIQDQERERRRQRRRFERSWKRAVAQAKRLEARLALPGSAGGGVQ